MSTTLAIHDLTDAALIHRRREINTITAALESEGKAIDAEIRARALSRPHEPLANGSREGRRATLRDGEAEVTVLFESDLLKASFAEDSPVARAVLPLLTAEQSAALFRCKTTYERTVKDGHKFRLQCADELGPDLAPQIIDKLKDRDKNGIVKSKTVIEWDKAPA